MRRSLVNTVAASTVGLMALLSIGTSAVLAKEGVSVNLVAPLPGDAAPGTIVPAVFTMIAIADDVESPLHKASPFLRLYGPRGDKTEASGVEQSTPGTYRAMIAIPAGGVARAEFGIHGDAKTSSGKIVATDPVWEYDGQLVTVRAVAPVAATAEPAPVAPAPAAQTVPATRAAASTPAFDARIATIAALALLAVAAVAIARRRLRTTPA